MPNPENIKNYKMKPGETLNPNGRPKGVKNRSTIVRQILEMKGVIPAEAFDKLKGIFPELKNDITVEEIMTIQQVNKAIKKADTNAYSKLMDSAYGLPKQEIQATNNNISEIKLIDAVGDTDTETPA
jgi:hypothetical protein